MSESSGALHETVMVPGEELSKVSPVISRLGGCGSSAAGGGSTTMMATVSLEVAKPSLISSRKVRLAGCGGAVNEGLGEAGSDRETGWPPSCVHR